MSLLGADRFGMSRMRFAAGDPLFFEWTYLGRDPVQLHPIALVNLCDRADPIPKRRKGIFSHDEQYGLLDRIVGVFGVVGGEEPSWDLTENGTPKGSVTEREIKRKVVALIT